VASDGTEQQSRNHAVTMSDPITEHGWTAVPVDPEAIFNGRPYLHKPAPVLAKDIHFPSDDPIVAKVQAYAKERLAPQAYNHSMRVFYWCTFPSSPFQPTQLLTQQPIPIMIRFLAPPVTGRKPIFQTSRK
jgi:cyanamide hydratase